MAGNQSAMAEIRMRKKRKKDRRKKLTTGLMACPIP